MVLKPRNRTFFLSLVVGIVSCAVYSFEITSWLIPITDRSKGIRQCTANILNKKVEYGVRVSKETEICDENKPYYFKTDAYAYTYIKTMKTVFTRPVEHFEDIIWNYSGTGNTRRVPPGLRFDLYFSSANIGYENCTTVKVLFQSHWRTLLLGFLYRDSNLYKRTGISLFYEYGKSEKDRTEIVKMDMPIDKSGHKIEKLTVIAQIESVKIMFDDKDFYTYQLKMHNMSNLNIFTVQVQNIYKNKVLFHGYQRSYE